MSIELDGETMEIVRKIAERSGITEREAIHDAIIFLYGKVDYTTENRKTNVA